jgi:hypothetical protein
LTLFVLVTALPIHATTNGTTPMLTEWGRECGTKGLASPGEGVYHWRCKGREMGTQPHGS